MCTAVRCEKCGKATWVGCGDHIEEALEPFSVEQRCQCDTTLTVGRPTN